MPLTHSNSVCDEGAESNTGAQVRGLSAESSTNASTVVKGQSHMLMPRLGCSIKRWCPGEGVESNAGAEVRV
eukprot:scaffold18479_cov18-Tisochrysis_lutea.AAC.4